MSVGTRASALPDFVVRCPPRNLIIQQCYQTARDDVGNGPRQLDPDEAMSIPVRFTLDCACTLSYTISERASV
jgi:hypothetical protein